MAIKVEVIGINQVMRVFEGMSPTLIDRTRRQIVKSGLMIETDAKRRAPSDTGRLRSSIQTEIREGGFEAIVFADAIYAAAVEKGSKPHFPPTSALEGWARRHGMEGLEFLIARAISKRGTPPRPFLFPAWETERPDFISEMKAIAKSLERG